jgi:hypothetical protein
MSRLDSCMEFCRFAAIPIHRHCLFFGTALFYIKVFCLINLLSGLRYAVSFGETGSAYLCLEKKGNPEGWIPA